MAKLVLSPGVKNVVDTLLGLAGLITGYLVSGQLNLPVPYDTLGPAVGLVGGYFVTDILSIVDTGVTPPVTVVESQLSAAWTGVRVLVVAEMVKLPASQQTQVNLAMSILDELAAATITPPAVVVSPVQPVQTTTTP